MSKRGVIVALIFSAITWAAIFGLIYAAVRWGPL
jgi:hypothetical protein